MFNYFHSSDYGESNNKNDKNNENNAAGIFEWHLSESPPCYVPHTRLISLRISWPSTQLFADDSDIRVGLGTWSLATWTWRFQSPGPSPDSRLGWTGTACHWHRSTVTVLVKRFKLLYCSIQLMISGWPAASTEPQRSDALAARLRAGPGLPVGPRKPTGQWQDAVLVPGPWLGPGFRAQLDPVGVDR